MFEIDFREHGRIHRSPTTFHHRRVIIGRPISGEIFASPLENPTLTPLALEFISGICNCSTEMICQQLRFQRTSIEISRVAPTTSNFGIPLNATESNNWISLLNFFQISSSRYPHTKVGKLDRSKLRFTNLCREQTRAKRSWREEASFQGVEVHLAYSRIHLFSPWHAAIAFMGAVKQVEGVRIEPRFEFLDQPLFMPFSPIFNPLR